MCAYWQVKRKPSQLRVEKGLIYAENEFFKVLIITNAGALEISLVAAVVLISNKDRALVVRAAERGGGGYLYFRLNQCGKN